MDQSFSARRAAELRHLNDVGAVIVNLHSAANAASNVMELTNKLTVASGTFADSVSNALVLLGSALAGAHVVATIEPFTVTSVPSSSTAIDGIVVQSTGAIVGYAVVAVLMLIIGGVTCRVRHKRATRIAPSSSPLPTAPPPEVINRQDWPGWSHDNLTTRDIYFLMHLGALGPDGQRVGVIGIPEDARRHFSNAMCAQLVEFGVFRWCQGGNLMGSTS